MNGGFVCRFVICLISKLRTVNMNSKWRTQDPTEHLILIADWLRLTSVGEPVGNKSFKGRTDFCKCTIIYMQSTLTALR